MAKPGDDQATVQAGDGTTPTRRTVIKAGAGAAALALGGGGLGVALVRAQDATPGETDATPTECVLTPQLTEGPYYVEGQLIRQDITEGKPGVPLRLRTTVVNTADDCQPLQNVAVDIWHCDAVGVYSGFTEASNQQGGPPPNGGQYGGNTALPRRPRKADPRPGTRAPSRRTTRRFCAVSS